MTVNKDYQYIGVIFIQIDQHLKKLFKKYKGVPILWNTVYGLMQDFVLTSSPFCQLEFPV